MEKRRRIYEVLLFRCCGQSGGIQSWMTFSRRSENCPQITNRSGVQYESENIEFFPEGEVASVR